jgi:hypothetical protein
LKPFSSSCPSRAGSVARERPPLGPFWVRKNPEVPHFRRLLRHLSVPSPLRPFCFPAAARYPDGTGRASIRRTMLPNSRRVRWPSAGKSQEYRAYFINRPLA